MSIEETAALLARAGLDRPTARVLAALAQGGEHATPEIEARAGLRQTDVSLGTQRLRARGWLASRTIPTGTRGRPTNLHMLKVPFESILEALGRDAPDPQAVAELRQKA